MTWALQQAVYAALAADAGVAALAGARIYDAVPREAAFPYLVIGDGSEADWSTKTDRGSAVTLIIRAWSRGAGQKEARQLAEAVRACLDGATLALGSGTLIAWNYLNTTQARDSDGVTRRADIRYRALIELGA
jgi:hypothetical protein